jgi:hypothetical protein
MVRDAKQTRRPPDLRVVSRSERSDLPPILTDPTARAEFERLTQALLEAVIEIMDLVDGDSDREPNGDEFEDDDGV